MATFSGKVGDVVYYVPDSDTTMLAKVIGSEKNGAIYIVSVEGQSQIVRDDGSHLSEIT